MSDSCTTSSSSEDDREGVEVERRIGRGRGHGRGTSRQPCKPKLKMCTHPIKPALIKKSFQLSLSSKKPFQN